MSPSLLPLSYSERTIQVIRIPIAIQVNPIGIGIEPRDIVAGIIKKALQI